MDEIRDKHGLRSIFFQKRKDIVLGRKQELDNAICSLIRCLPEYKKSERILVYSPIRNEIDLNILFADIYKDGKSTLFPRCFGKEMRFAAVNADKLERGSFGILEPSVHCDYANVYTSADVCILPCLAVDRNGYRLGYGGGFYDRFLADFPGVKVVAVYSDFITDTVFHESFDIPADIIVSEDGIFRI